MNNKDCAKNGITGTGMFVAAKTSDKVIQNDIDELEGLHTVDAEKFQNIPKEAHNDFVIHKAATRGKADHGWLESYQTFSFANYYNPERMHFGVLRVLNDDRVDPGMGFGKHPHDNMEIISIPLEGDLEHQDSMGNSAVIKEGDIQAMSAGTGIFHSEYNKNKDRDARFLQIWVFPNKKNVTPHYSQITLNLNDRHNKLQQIVSPDETDAGVTIQQNAWFHLGRFDKGFKTDYQIKDKANGAYAFIIKGDMKINGKELNQRDGIGLWNIESLDIESLSEDAELLIMDVPMVIE